MENMRESRDSGASMRQLLAGWSFSGESIAVNRAVLGAGALRSSTAPGKGRGGREDLLC